MPDLPDAPFPGLDPAWDEAFVVELRLLGVTGDRIGAALAEAVAHCVDSGESRQAAFGDPTTYARDLDLPRTATKGPDALTVAATLGAWIGVAIWFRTTDGWQDGQRQVDITVGNLTAVALLCALGALLVLFRARAEDAVMRHPMLVPVVTAGVVAGTLAWISGTLGDPVITLDWRVTAATGTALLLADLAHSLLSGSREDPVVAPTGGSRSGGQGPTRGDQLLRSATPWAPITVAVTAAVLGFWG